MDTSLLVAYIDIVSAPVLILYVLFSVNIRKYSFVVRFGAFIASLGMLLQAYIVFNSMDQLKGLGTLWALKDIGLSLIAMYIATSCLVTTIKKVIQNA